MSDLISRSALIEAFEPEHDCDWYTPDIIETINKQPPVEPVRGEWIEGAEYMDSDGIVNQEVFCPVCSASASYTLDPPNFCSNCGTYMRKES